MAGSGAGGGGGGPGEAAEAVLSTAQKGYLHCQLQMGHLQGMLTQVDGWALSAPGAPPAQTLDPRLHVPVATGMLPPG